MIIGQKIHVPIYQQTISNFEHVFAYWVNKAEPCLCFVQGYQKSHQNDVSEVALISSAA